MASLSPSLTDTVIGLFDFGGGVSGVLLPLALLLLLVTLIVSFAGTTVIGFFVIGAGVSGGLLLPLALLLLLVTLIVSFVGPSEVSVFVVGFLLIGAGVFSMEEDVFFPEDSCCLAVALSVLPLPLLLLDRVFLGVVVEGVVSFKVEDFSCCT